MVESIAADEELDVAAILWRLDVETIENQPNVLPATQQQSLMKDSTSTIVI